MVGSITAPRKARAARGMGLAGAGIQRSLGLGRVLSSLEAVQTVAKPRRAAIPAEGANELASVAGASLVQADHAETLKLSG